MSESLLLTRSDVAALLPMGDCIEAVERAFRAQAEGRALPSGVLGVHAPAGGLHVKAAGLTAGRAYIAAKVNANFPGNPDRGLPTIQGVIVLCDGDDGRPLAVMDSIEVTALRTAAATAVAARYLARADARRLALVGCGTQAAYQARAVAAVRPIVEIAVHDRDGTRARDLAARLEGELGLPVRVADSARAAAREADVIVTCTPAREPILGPDEVGPGSFVAGVGADNPHKWELDPRLLASSRLVVDSLEQAATIGDLHHALDAGVITRDDVHAELWQVVSGTRPGRGTDGEIAVFDSTGVAIEDVAAAAQVYERAVAAGRGHSLDLGA